MIRNWTLFDIIVYFSLPSPWHSISSLAVFHLPSTLLQQVQDYKDSLIKKAEQLIIQGFPEKIVELNELLDTPMFSERNFTEVHQDLNIPVPDPILVSNNGSDAAADGSANTDGGDADQPAAKRARTEPPAAVGTKVMYLPSGSVPCNTPLCEMIKVVKPIIRKLVEDCKYHRCFPIQNLF